MFVASLFIVTTADGTAAPDASVIVPTIDPAMFWPHPIVANVASKNRTALVFHLKPLPFDVF